MSSLTARAGSSFGAWSKTTTDDEYLAKLKFPKGAVIYDQMRRSDPQVGAVLQAVYSSIIAASWVVEPASEASQDVEIAKFIEYNLFPARREIDTEQLFMTPWTQTLRNILLHVPFGYMVMEKVFTSSEGKIVLEDLAPRLPRTIAEFKYEKKGNVLLEVVQKVSGTKYQIPAEKCIIFTFNKEGTNAAGISMLRTLYKPWAIKDDLEKIQAIMFERYGVGIPVGTVGERSKSGDDDFDAMESALGNIASNEEGYLVLPNGQEINMLGNGTTTAPDILSAIKYYDNQIAIAYHAMFMMLGSTNSGNRALGETFMDFFLTTVQSIGDSVADTLNNELVPELVQLNFTAVNFPRLVMLPIQDVDFKVIAALRTAGLISSTEETEQRLRQLVGINELEEGEYDKDKSTEKVDNKDVATDDDVDPVEVEASTKGSKTVKHFARRKFNEDEIAFGLPEMELQLDKKQETTKNHIIKLRNRQGRSIAEQIGDKKLPANIVVPHRKEMYNYLLEVYKDQRQLGKEQAAKDAKRQGLKLAAPPSTANELLDLVERMLSVEVDGASNKLKAMLLEKAIGLERTGIIGNKLELALVDYMQDKISEATWVEMASTAVNNGWGDGHISFVDSVKDSVNFQTYSAVLDDNTCEVCRDADNHTHPVGDPDYVAPNPGCLGGDKCRCVNITFYKGAE